MLFKHNTYTLKSCFYDYLQSIKSIFKNSFWLSKRLKTPLYSLIVKKNSTILTQPNFLFFEHLF
jgi:hypothetical protein